MNERKNENIKEFEFSGPTGVKLVLLAFEYFHNETGERRLDASALRTPDVYAASIARQKPDRFE